MLQLQLGCLDFSGRRLHCSIALTANIAYINEAMNIHILELMR